MKTIMAVMTISIMLSGCTGSKAPHIDLSGQWKIIPGDNARCSTPEFDDKNFDEVAVPGEWNYIIRKSENYSATIWIRKKIYIGEEFSGKLLDLYLGRIFISDETYFNGILVGSNGSIPSDMQSSDNDLNFSVPRNYTVPASVVRIKADNVIAVRVFSHIFNGVNGIPRLSVGGSRNMQDRIGELYNGLIRGGIITIDCILLVFFLILLIGEKKSPVLLLSLAIIAVHGLLNLVSFNIISLGGILTSLKIILSLILAEFFIALLIFHVLFRISVRAVPAAALFLFISDILLVLCTKSSEFLVHFSGPVTLILFVVYTLYIFGVFFYSVVFRDPMRYLFFIPLAFPVFILVVYNIYRFYDFQLYKIADSALAAVPILMISVMFFKIFDLKQVQKENDSLAKALLKERYKFNHFKKISSRGYVKPEPRDIVNDLVDYLDKNYFETYNRRDLAKRFGLNEDYMGQLFRKTTGTNISGYINSKRIEASAQLLLDTDGKIIDIAYHIGFDNLTHFHRLFKKMMGCTPTEYRKKNSDVEEGDD